MIFFEHSGVFSFQVQYVLDKEILMDKELLSILVCPVTKAPLEYDKEAQELVCKASGLAYPIRDGIPFMIESEARKLSSDEKLAKSKISSKN